MITVFADQHLYKISEIIPEEIDLRLYNPENGFPEDIDRADALLIRTVTPLNKKTLSPVPQKLKFVGTASAGTDHVEPEYLRRNEVKFAYSPGCNARSVAEYVVTGLLIWAEARKADLERETIGIVGVGHVGSALKKILDRLEWDYLLYDPPKSRRDSSFKSASLQDVLECPILTFHTPLTRTGPNPTYHWLSSEKLTDHSYKLIINTSRGAVVDEKALLDSMEHGTVGDIIVDVWEEEPVFHDKTARRAFIATPHIAGYSIQSKYRASRMIVEALEKHFLLDLSNHQPAPSETDVSPSFDANGLENLTLAEILYQIHPLRDYQEAFQKLIGLGNQSKIKAFNRLRTSIPYRNEYSAISLPKKIYKQFPILKHLFCDF